MRNNKIHQRGFGLVEVLIAAVIFALGSLALVQLQGDFFKSSSAANARSVAMSIAQEKIEDLRGFAATSGNFDSIADNVGGRTCVVGTDEPDTGTACTGTELSRPSGTVARNNASYTRSWTASNFYYDTAGTLLDEATCTASSICGADNTSVPASPDQKNLVVTIAWTDTDGTAQTLTDDSIINSHSTASGGAVVASTGGSGEQATVPYSPSADTRVNPISVGTDSKRETLVPESTIVNGYVQSSFTAYTYNSSNVLLREEEFRNVACSCAFDGTSSSGNETYEASYPAWSGDKDSFEDVTGDLVTGKVKGCVDNNSNGTCDSNPDQYCEICCRDHHDKAGSSRKYDPYRSSDDFDATTGDHNHYNGTTPVTSGTYQESCRLKRVDGYWRVFQDWHMVNLDTIPITDLEDATIKSNYSAYVKSIVDEHIDESKVAGETLTSPPTEPSATNHNTSGNYVTMASGDVSQISARALYIDYIDATLLSQIQSKKAAGQDYLLHMPFYELEAASLTDWSSADTSTVLPGPVDNPGTANDIAADEMTAVATNANAVVVSGSIRKSNTGLTALNYAADYNASSNADDTENSDSMTVCVGSSCSAPISSCTTPWGTSVSDGASVYGYSASSVTYPTACSSVQGTLTCSSGTLSNSATYTNSSCTQLAGASDCTTAGGWVIGDGSSATAYSAQTASDCTTIDTTLSCSSGTLSEPGGSPSDYAYQSCTQLTCSTTISGVANNKNDAITINDGTTTTACLVAASKSYTCPTVSTSTGTTITVTSTGTVNSTVSVSACGAKTVNF